MAGGRTADLDADVSRSWFWRRLGGAFDGDLLALLKAQLGLADGDDVAVVEVHAALDGQAIAEGARRRTKVCQRKGAAVIVPGKLGVAQADGGVVDAEVGAVAATKQRRGHRDGQAGADVEGPAAADHHDQGATAPGTLGRLVLPDLGDLGTLQGLGIATRWRGPTLQLPGEALVGVGGFFVDDVAPQGWGLSSRRRCRRSCCRPGPRPGLGPFTQQHCRGLSQSLGAVVG